MAQGTGWILDEADRQRLLGRFPPRHADIIAHHVTLWSRHDKPDAPPAPAHLAVVGHADDGRGIEALVVAVNGSTDRPDGSTFHITWSIDPASGCVAKLSNNLIAEAGWTSIEPPIPFAATPDWL
ncbi:hypothetical protein [Sphingomicrobium flavum]|uniref:hypothetical protein n=1 Tax=Sphingomicrobium flavum TaxID=1229164 RepID=UPI0021ADF5F7|nr:hypothetical protein [Sphingomicrobium flavum]